VFFYSSKIFIGLCLNNQIIRVTSPNDSDLLIKNRMILILLIKPDDSDFIDISNTADIIRRTLTSLATLHYFRMILPHDLWDLFLEYINLCLPKNFGQ